MKIRDADSRTVKNKAVYIALGVTRDGLREVLGLWPGSACRQATDRNTPSHVPVTRVILRV